MDKLFQLPILPVVFRKLTVIHGDTPGWNPRAASAAMDFGVIILGVNPENPPVPPP